MRVRWWAVPVAGATVLSILLLYASWPSSSCGVGIDVYVMVEDRSLPQHVYDASAYPLSDGYLLLDGARVNGNSTVYFLDGGGGRSAHHEVIAPRIQGYSFLKWTIVGAETTPTSVDQTIVLSVRGCFAEIIAWYAPN